LLPGCRPPSVNRVVPAPQLAEAVEETAGAIVRTAPLALAASKLALRKSAGGRAIREKRAPRFTGR
jgi:hypothetical protein